MITPSPNILWVLTDQLHAACLGHAGRPEVRTPHLDALARDATRFAQAYCNNPICGPSRVSMITGRYPHDTRITGNNLFDTDLPLPPGGTVATRLRHAGYRTALVGKAHMIGTWDDAGFEQRRYCDLCDSPRGNITHNHYFRYLIDHGLADRYDLGARFEGQPGHELKRFVSDIPEAHTVETWTGDQALGTLDRFAETPSRPWMMQLSFQRPHEPLCVPPERTADYDPAGLTLPDNAADFFDRRFAGKPTFQRDYIKAGVRGYPYRPEDRGDLAGQLAHYYTLITMIDRQIGRVIDHLKTTGDYSNTLILFTADHGDFAGEHGLILKNLGLYEAIHRVPLLVKWPTSRTGSQQPEAGTTHDGLVELVDLAPTMLDAAGLDADDLPGRRLADVATGRAAPLRHTVCEYDFSSAQPFTVAVRDHRWRLVLYPWQTDAAGQRIGELYDHDADPGELDNRFDDPAATADRLRLTDAALAHVSRFRRDHSTRDDPNSPVDARVLFQQRGMPWAELEQRLR